MIKVDPDVNACDLLQHVSTKFSEHGLQDFLLKYLDEEQTPKDIGDEDDLQNFLNNPKIKKQLIVQEI